MSFLVRQAEHKDLQDIYNLAKQFTLLNLPAKANVIESIIDKSIHSFNGELEKEKAIYLFVVEDTEEKKVVATSLILAKHGTIKTPHYSFEIYNKDHFSKDIGIGFKHNVLRFKEDTDGPSEIGGLLLDKPYRNKPEKIGSLISMIRFMYMGMFPDRFEKKILCELSPPLTREGRSEFWEALGRRFTGLPYEEADQISETNKEFIHSLFPKEDIYLCLLDAKARLSIGRVADATVPAKHMLEKVGFSYTNEVDPFDGGPHYKANLGEIKVVQEMERAQISFQEDGVYEDNCMLTAITDKGFRGGSITCEHKSGKVKIPARWKEILSLSEGQEVFVYHLS